MAKEQVGFKTSVFGFRKVDVLAYIDCMSAEHLSEQQKEQARVTALEETVSTLTEEKAVLATALSEKKEQIVVFHQALASQTEIAAAAQQKTNELSDALKKAEASARDYQGRLFVREGEATVLRRDNANLTRALTEKQQELERVFAQAETAQREAVAQLELVQGSAQAEIVALNHRADVQKETLQQDMQQALEAQRKQFDAEKERERIKAAEKAASAQNYYDNLGKNKRPCTATRRKTSTPTISSLLLAKIAKMIGEV